MLQLEAAGAGHVTQARLERTDGEPLRRLFCRLSPETVYRRFMSPLARPDQARPDRLLDLDHFDREAVAAVVDGEIVGVARYFRLAQPDSAEIAVVVADAWQRQGLGTRMLASLAELAGAAGIVRFKATMLADNRAAPRLLRRFDAGVHVAFSQGVYEATVPIRREIDPR